MYALTPYRSALLDTINWAEGSPDYDELFNYVKFNNNGPHPNTPVTAGGYTSTAAGKYQFLYGTWHDTIDYAGLPDYMDPDTQDQAAIARVDMRGALDLIDAGNIDAAIPVLAYEWASFPGSPYGQPTKSLGEFLDYYDGRVAFYDSSAPELFAGIGIDPSNVPTGWWTILAMSLILGAVYIFIYIHFNRNKS